MIAKPSAPSDIPTPLPRRVLSGPPPAPLRPVFASLDAWTTPIPIDILRCHVDGVRLSLDDVRDAVVSDPDAYVRTLIHAGPAYEALIMCWLPGQRSPIHDHAGSACAVRIISGAAVETIYALDAAGFASPRSQSVFTAGAVACSVDADVHTMANALRDATPGETLVTLHIYSPPLRGSRKYHLATHPPTP